MRVAFAAALVAAVAAGAQASQFSGVSDVVTKAGAWAQAQLSTPEAQRRQFTCGLFGPINCPNTTGDACTSQCTDPLYCNSMQCAQKPGSGQMCSQTAPCYNPGKDNIFTTTLSCEAGTCAEVPYLNGGDCCSDSTHCPETMNGTMVGNCTAAGYCAWTPGGAACRGDQECLHGWSCANSDQPGGGTCVEGAAAGGACSWNTTAMPCAIGLTCAEATGTCVTEFSVANGQPCGTAGFKLECAETWCGADGNCAAPAQQDMRTLGTCGGLTGPCMNASVGGATPAAGDCWCDRNEASRCVDLSASGFVSEAQSYAFAQCLVTGQAYRTCSVNGGGCATGTLDDSCCCAEEQAFVGCFMPLFLDQLATMGQPFQCFTFANDAVTCGAAAPTCTLPGGNTAGATGTAAATGTGSGVATGSGSGTGTASSTTQASSSSDAVTVSAVAALSVAAAAVAAQ